MFSFRIVYVHRRAHTQMCGLLKLSCARPVWLKCEYRICHYRRARHKLNSLVIIYIPFWIFAFKVTAFPTFYFRLLQAQLVLFLAVTDVRVVRFFYSLEMRINFKLSPSVITIIGFAIYTEMHPIFLIAISI